MRLLIFNAFFPIASNPTLIKTVKLLEENPVEHPHEFEIGKHFLNSS